MGYTGFRWLIGGSLLLLPRDSLRFVGWCWLFHSLLPLPRYFGGFRWLVLPPAGYFPVMESNQRSPGLRARTRGRGAAVEIMGPANPLAVTRRFGL